MGMCVEIVEYLNIAICQGNYRNRKERLSCVTATGAQLAPHTMCGALVAVSWIRVPACQTMDALWL